MKTIKNLQKLAFFVLMGFSLCIIQACGDDGNDGKLDNPLEEENQKPGNKPDDEPVEPSIEHEWVDLGLSVKWATCNVGANVPEEYGDYFAWGEIQTKEKYDWESYKWVTCINDSINYIKYGPSDKSFSLEKEDDAAIVIWGDDWRMPTRSEIAELCNECTWCETELNGIAGYEVIGKNGNSIFIPENGYYFGNEHRKTIGIYWSSDCFSEFSFGGIADALTFKIGSVHEPGVEGADFYIGCGIRPVVD